METINVYSAEELKELNPEAYQRAFDKFKRDTECDPCPWQEETFESLKAVVNALNFNLNDYSLGAYCQCLLKVSGEAEDLTGSRALAYIDNHLSCKSERLVTPLENPEEFKKQHSYGYRGWKPRPVSLTGYFADDVFLEEVRLNVIKYHMTLKEALESLADTYQELAEADCEQASSEEAFLSWAEDGRFTKDGIWI